jgi:hypothetical protein
MDITLDILIAYLRPEFLFIAVGIFILGQILKITPLWDFISSWFPLIALGLSFLTISIFTLFSTDHTAAIWITNSISAIIVAALSVFSWESFGKFFQRRR